MGRIKLIFWFSLGLTLVNFWVIYNYVFSSFTSNPSQSIEKCQPVSTPKKSSKEIQLNFNIMDIYRIDVSCDYIIRDLGSKISNEFVNKNKKCSASSLNLDLNTKIQNSLLNQKNDSYIPFLNKSVPFDPFDDNTQPEVLNNLQLGGLWKPKLHPDKECKLDDLDHVVFVVPFSRSRYDNLKLFLINMHSYLQSYQYSFSYRILVVEQIDMDSKFNKGRLINSAVKHLIESKENADCIVIHDVDLVPSAGGNKLGERGDYRCRKMPWHLSRKVFNLKMNHERIYNQFLTGGILSLRMDHFVRVNGFSNEYFGWGAEDDDFQIRMFNTKLCILRPDLGEKASFMMLPHDSSKASNSRFSYLSNALSRQKEDGLSNIIHLAEIKSLKYFKSFTHLQVLVKKINR
ncbi:beta-1-4-N-acetylgalactosaminyltransferase bre-4 [Brachionus plicatilis]|uniref:Beta-1,4-galactosyltransferase n=1 Tax=Brachionus plicatilis TaxID=10195 RepID=A0A3M7SU75_BRAPC|nr:beta-1-4-N-acetylgalactosaminyltransferase bre-4 [Brachionus plicatilis]